MYIISLLALFQCPVCSVQIYIMRVISMSSNTGGEGERVSLKLTQTPPHLCLPGYIYKCRHRHHWHDKLSQAFLLFLCILQAIWMVGGPWNEAISSEQGHSQCTFSTKKFNFESSASYILYVLKFFTGIILQKQKKKKKLATKLSWLTIEWCATY